MFVFQHNGGPIRHTSILQVGDDRLVACGFRRMGAQVLVSFRA